MLGHIGLRINILNIMAKKRKKKNRRHGSLQVVTLCISTAMVLILLGMVVFSVLTAHNLSSYVKENLTVTLMLGEDITSPEAQRLCDKLNARPFTAHTTYISPEQALKEHVKAMGADPREFLDGGNPFVGSIEMQMVADYANSDSLKWISKELNANKQITEVTYPKNLIDEVNDNIRKVSVVLLILAALLTFVSFSLINNTVRLSVYARRFTIHTMKLVGASWNFIRWPFIKRALGEGLVAAVIADGVLAGCLYGLYTYTPDIQLVVDWVVVAITAGSVFLFGLLLTTICSFLSVNKFLKMTAGDLYKI